MSNLIGVEVRLFLDTFLLGVLLIFLYDIIRIFRCVIKHTKTWEAVEDTIYWIIAGFIVFIMLYHNNDGVIRWFAIAGVGAGMFLYNISVSKFVVKYVSLVINKMIKIIGKVLKILFKPIVHVLRQLSLSLKKLIKLLKNSYKTFKMKKKQKKNGVKNEKARKKKKKKKRQ